jgi:hypothetical protein
MAVQQVNWPKTRVHSWTEFNGFWSKFSSTCVKCNGQQNAKNTTIKLKKVEYISYNESKILKKNKIIKHKLLCAYTIEKLISISNCKMQCQITRYYKIKLSRQKHATHTCFE